MDRLHYCHLARNFRTIRQLVLIEEFIIKKFSCQISVKRLLQFHDLTNDFFFAI